MLQLIVESGSTKTDWALIEKKSGISRLVRSWQSRGLNPVLLSSKKLSQLLSKATRKLEGLPIAQVDFYGAGCEKPEAQIRIKDFFERNFGAGQVLVANDLLAAAQACSPGKAGIICILGTGSSSALYDGKNLLDALPGLGYILGDEGSGAYIGKKLLQAFFYGHMPADLEKTFALWLSPEELPQPDKLRSNILDKVYRQKAANKYLASLTHFISAHPHSFLDQLVKQSFNKFLQLLHRYPKANRLPVHFVGSIAWHFQKQLKSALQDRQLQTGRILQKPMEKLIEQSLNKPEPHSL